MLGHYQNEIKRLSRRLHALKEDPENLTALVDLQKCILKRILKTERSILNYKKRLPELKKRLRSGRLVKSEALNLKQSIDFLENKISSAHHLLFIWRTFGDGIAFIYVNKWSMKPLFYNVSDPSAKQDAGFITGKAGLKLELDTIERAKENDIPALLADITNSIRHGDVCLMIDDDPCLLEVKSSKNRNTRVTRQITDIQRIHDYFESDEAFDVRGVPRLTRRSLPLIERNYLKYLDEAIHTAIREGLGILDLEEGTRLIVVGDVEDFDYERTLIGMEKPVIYLINSAKSEGVWGCYYPFTLSICDPNCVCEFIVGNVYIIVAYDYSKIKKMAFDMGLEFASINEEEWLFKIECTGPSSENKGSVKISEHFAHRMALELISWQWVLEVEKIRLNEASENSNA